MNVIVSNVPGPREPLYFSGAQLEQYIPVSTIAEGMGLNITVHSYLDELTFGLISCRELVPDLWKMVDLHIDEIDRLFEATGAEWAVPPRPAPPRRGPAEAPGSGCGDGCEAGQEGGEGDEEGVQEVVEDSKSRRRAKAPRRAKKRAPAKAAS